MRHRLTFCHALAAAFLVCAVTPATAADKLEFPDRPMMIDLGDEGSKPAKPAAETPSQTPSVGESDELSNLTATPSPPENLLEASTETSATAPGRPKPAPFQNAGKALPWIILGAVVFLGAVIALYVRRLYFDNVFDRTYLFPIESAQLRLGATSSGGHGASISYGKGGPKAQ